VPSLVYALHMTPVATGRPGRPAAATREDALELAADRLRAGQRVDVRGIALELGPARATIPSSLRWTRTTATEL